MRQLYCFLSLSFVGAIKLSTSTHDTLSTNVDFDLESLSDHELNTIIIGAGFSGLITFAKMRKAGFDPNSILIIEQNANFGGTWEDFQYPGVAVDAFFYPPLFDETREFYPKEFLPSGHDIRLYARKMGEVFGMLNRTRFNEKVIHSEYLESEGKWLVKTDQGAKLKTKTVVMATGFAQNARLPEIDAFQGPVFYAKSRWSAKNLSSDHVVGLVGTGPAGAQILPRIKDHVKKVIVFMKNAHWNFPRPKGKLTHLHSNIFNCIRYGDECFTDLRKKYWVPMVSNEDCRMDDLEQCGLNFLEQSVKNETVRNQLTPNEFFGCRRLIVNNEFFDSFNSPNVELVSVPEGVHDFSENHVHVGSNSYKIDALVMATGYEFCSLTHKVTGKNKTDLEAYMPSLHGSEYSNFPNFFRVGPNKLDYDIMSVLGSASRQIDHVVQMLNKMRKENLRTIEAKKSAVKASSKRDYKAFRDSKFAQCQSWVYRHVSRDYVPIRFDEDTQEMRHLSNENYLFN